MANGTMMKTALTIPYPTAVPKLSVLCGTPLKWRKIATAKFCTPLTKPTCWTAPACGEKVVNEIAADYPEVEVHHMYVDNAAMQLVVNPTQFDVIVTENMFGDIFKR